RHDPQAAVVDPGPLFGVTQYKVKAHAGGPGGDRTVTRCHLILNPPATGNPLSLAATSNQRSQDDRFDYPRTLTGLIMAAPNFVRQPSVLIVTPRDPELDRRIKLAIIAAAGFFMLLGLVFGAAPTKIVVTLVCLLTVQGLWRGAGELVGLVASTLCAVVFAPPLGRGFEGLFNGIFGTGGVMGRGISIAIVGVIIIASGTI